MLWLIAAVGSWSIWWLPDAGRPTCGMQRRPTAAPRRWSSIVLAAILLANFVQLPPRQLVAAALMCRRPRAGCPPASSAASAQRSFFGVYRVQTAADGAYHTLMHGTTLHGAQRFRDDEGKPVDDTVAHHLLLPGQPDGADHRQAARGAAASEKGRYGIVGLGTGSSACHKREGETWRFFEIDPSVIKIAKNPKNFTFITQCQPDIDIAIGDARLTIAKEPDDELRPVHHRRVLLRRDPGAHADQGGGPAVPRQAEAGRRGAAAHLQPLPRPRTRCWARSRRSCLPGTAGIVVSDDECRRQLRAVDLDRGDLRQERGGARALPLACRASASSTTAACAPGPTTTPTSWERSSARLQGRGDADRLSLDGFARRAGAIGKTASGVPAAAQTTS